MGSVQTFSVSGTILFKYKALSLNILILGSCKVWVLFLISTVAFVFALSLLSYVIKENDSEKTFLTLLSDNTIYTFTLLISNGKYTTE